MWCGLPALGVGGGDDADFGGIGVAAASCLPWLPLLRLPPLRRDMLWSPAGGFRSEPLRRLPDDCDADSTSTPVWPSAMLSNASSGSQHIPSCEPCSSCKPASFACVSR